MRGSAAVVAALLVLGGLGSAQSSLSPQSRQARDIAALWWWMLGGAFVGVAVVTSILVAAWFLRGRRGIGTDTEGDKPGERVSTAVVLGLGVAVPIVLLATLFVVSDVVLIRV